MSHTLKFFQISIHPYNFYIPPPKKENDVKLLQLLYDLFKYHIVAYMMIFRLYPTPKISLDNI